MIEAPESVVIANQISTQLKDKKIIDVTAMHTPHKLVWTFKEPSQYSSLLKGKVITGAQGLGSQIELECENIRIVLSDGFIIKHTKNNDEIPDKHQLLIKLDDGSYLVAWVQMYGGLACFVTGEYDNKYYLVAKEKPFVLSKEFTLSHWKSLFTPEVEKLSTKAFLATEQRIPGLGNGVLQDILFNAKIHPKTKINKLSDIDRENLYGAVVSTLNHMVEAGGRDTEKDLYGNSGDYQTIMSTKAINLPCPNCKGNKKKYAYMGGSVYVCENCQKEVK